MKKNSNSQTEIEFTESNAPNQHELRELLLQEIATRSFQDPLAQIELYELLETLCDD